MLADSVVAPSLFHQNPSAVQAIAMALMIALRLLGHQLGNFYLSSGF